MVPRTDPDYYREKIWPKLARFTPAEIAEATGLSASYCKRIRLGTRMSPVRWWQALETLAASSDE